MYSEPSGHWPAQPPAPAPAAPRERPDLGVFVLVGGFATALFGIFALPVQNAIKDDDTHLSEVYYGTLNQVANLDNGRIRVLGSVARLWWSYLGLTVFGVLAVAVAVAAAVPAARRLAGWVSVLATVAALALYSVALQQTGNINAFLLTFRNIGTSFDVAGSGL
jgi:hypothetical protein